MHINSQTDTQKPVTHTFAYNHTLRRTDADTFLHTHSHKPNHTHLYTDTDRLTDSPTPQIHTYTHTHPLTCTDTHSPISTDPPMHINILRHT